MNHEAPSSPTRRAFLGRVTVSVGGVSLGGLLPASLLQAAPAACLVDATRYADPCGDWQLDDVFTAYPPYSMHPASPVPREERIGAALHPADQYWVG